MRPHLLQFLDLGILSCAYSSRAKNSLNFSSTKEILSQSNTLCPASVKHIGIIFGYDKYLDLYHSDVLIDFVYSLMCSISTFLDMNVNVPMGQSLKKYLPKFCHVLALKHLKTLTL